MNLKWKNTVIEIICLLYILLFVYAGISKLLDYNDFRIQLGQSPILSPFAGWVSILVPISEFIISFLLAFKTTRRIALLSAFSLMILFSFYIYIILNYSTFIPCSCGGILEKMSWKQHLIFNLIFAVLGGYAFLLFPNKSNGSNCTKQINFKIALLLSVFFSAGLTMAVLFSFSEHIVHYKNRFIRRFPQHAAQEVYKIDLKFNSYYFAGFGDGKLYLGNYTSPFRIVVFDTLSKAKSNFQITLKEKELPFSRPKIKVFENNFFLYEGTVPYLFKGETRSWYGKLKLNGGYLFSSVEPMDSLNMAVRYLVPKTGENALGNLNLNNTEKAKFNKELLRKQFDGIFDTDGILTYNNQLNRMIYAYYYRNEFFVIKPNLELDFKGNTIDTISHAQVELMKYKNSRMKTFAKPPLTVNKAIATYGRFLYVNSALPGLYESEKIWKTASIIDVYDLSNRTYRSSFLIYDSAGKKVKAMAVYGPFIYVLIGNQLICYKLRSYLAQDKSVRKSTN
ncbi:MauE/DoxX family redox-associated membrane protein [Flavobacterium ginsenosidimutans]|uniref:MauE/DoxX family redox-associated membrane protein n=1 Tax=Flavobacterium ginsenosidimutans TaxID=687844 RepID=UPI003D97CAF4